MKYPFLFTTLYILFAFHCSIQVQASPLFEVEKVTSAGVIYFKTPLNGMPLKPLQTGLQDLEVLDIFDKEPAQILVMGRPCENCIQEKAIYFFKLTGGKTAQFVYPGHVKDPKTHATLLDSRAFFGQCLDRSQESVYLVFQREKIDRRAGHPSSVLVATPRSDGVIHEKLYERHLPSLKTTLKRTKKKQPLCHEIAGYTRMMLTKIPDFMFTETDEWKETDELEKESITKEEFPSEQD
jgi:hypothetical protein